MSAPQDFPDVKLKVLPAVGFPGPAGPTGPIGPIGPIGPAGPNGGTFADAPADGSTYGRNNNAWVVGGGGVPATALPLMDATPAVVGVSTKYAREDHVHPTDTSAVRLITNDNIIGGALAGSSLTSATLNILIGKNAGKNLAGGTGENTVVGNGTGIAMTTGTQNTIVGAEAGAAITGDTGHTLVGWQAGFSLNSNAQTWNTFVGHVCGRFVTTGGSNVAFGRGAMATETDGSYITAVGHAAYFTGIHGLGVIAIGDSAGGADTAGASTNWQGSGLTYWGSINDVSDSYIGRFTGKSSAASRSNSHAFGTLARIPLKDNVMVLGHGLAAVETAGHFWDGWNRQDFSATVASTIPAASMLVGALIRTGAMAANFSDTTDTAANIVAAGPGANCEVPASTEVSIGNLTSFTMTLLSGAGCSFSGLGLGNVFAAGVFAKIRIIIANSTPGSESVTFYRVG